MLKNRAHSGRHTCGQGMEFVFLASSLMALISRPHSEKLNYSLIIQFLSLAAPSNHLGSFKHYYGLDLILGDSGLIMEWGTVQAQGLFEAL